MKLFGYRGFQISTDKSFIDNEILAKQPYTFHRDGEVLHIYFNPAGDPLAQILSHPIKKLKVRKKDWIKKLIDKNHEELQNACEGSL